MDVVDNFKFMFQSSVHENQILRNASKFLVDEIDYEEAILGWLHLVVISVFSWSLSKEKLRKLTAINVFREC